MHFYSQKNWIFSTFLAKKSPKFRYWHMKLQFFSKIEFWGFGSKSFAQNCFGLTSFGFWVLAQNLPCLIPMKKIDPNTDWCFKTKQSMTCRIIHTLQSIRESALKKHRKALTTTIRLRACWVRGLFLAFFSAAPSKLIHTGKRSWDINIYTHRLSVIMRRS